MNRFRLDVLPIVSILSGVVQAPLGGGRIGEMSGLFGGLPCSQPTCSGYADGDSLLAQDPSIFKVYGITTTDEALHPTPELRKLYDEASAITHVTKDDPPVFMIDNEPDGDLPPDARPGQGIHHPRFAQLLTPKLDALGIPRVYRHTSDGKGGNPQREMLEFFKKQFVVP